MISVVGDERMPNLFSFLPTENPGKSFSMIKAVVSLGFAMNQSQQTQHKYQQRHRFVIKIFDPFKT